MRSLFDALGGRKSAMSFFSMILIATLLVLNKKFELGLTAADLATIAAAGIGGVAGLAWSDASAAK